MAVHSIVKGVQIDRGKVMDELKGVIDSDDLEVESRFDQDAKSFSVTLTVPLGERNFEPVNRLIAMSVDAAL